MSIEPNFILTVKGTWTEIFDKEFPPDETHHFGWGVPADVEQRLKQFIKKEREEWLSEFLNQPANQHDQEVRRQAWQELKVDLTDWAEENAYEIYNPLRKRVVELDKLLNKLK